jgi:hypothetical protein
MEFEEIMRRIFALVSILGFFQLEVQAAPREYEFGAGAISSGLAGSGVASLGTAAATYLNPANLSRCERSSFELGGRYLTSLMNVNQTVGPKKPVHLAQDSFILELGGCAAPLVGLGIGVWVASDTLKPVTLGLTTNTDDIYFTRFGSALASPTIMAGVGYSFIPQVALGISVLVTMRTLLTQDVFAPLASSSGVFSTAVGANVSARASVVAGLTLRPWNFVSVGAAFRTANYGRLDIDAKTEASALGIRVPVHMFLSGVHDYSPRQYAFGATFKPWDCLSLITDLNYAAWSKYQGPFLSVTPDPESSVSTGIALPALEFSFKDVWTPRVGAELLLLDDIALRAGYSY